MSVDFSITWKTALKIVNEVVATLPNIILAFVIFVLFLVGASLADSLTRRLVQKRRTHQGVALLLARLVHTSIVVIGFLIGLSVVAPSFEAGDLVKLLGIGTVAVGFAFQNILQNFLAGILVLLQEPFRLGDFINVTGIEGSVSDIQARATIVRTEDGREVVIPMRSSSLAPWLLATTTRTNPDRTGMLELAAAKRMPGQTAGWGDSGFPFAVQFWNFPSGRASNV